MGTDKVERIALEVAIGPAIPAHEPALTREKTTISHGFWWEGSSLRLRQSSFNSGRLPLEPRDSVSRHERRPFVVIGLERRSGRGACRSRRHVSTAIHPRRTVKGLAYSLPAAAFFTSARIACRVSSERRCQAAASSARSDGRVG